ncbi:MAG: peptidyl-prolyl cis-trans isomerase [Sulfurimonas sp.]|nr:peptidyl-prolyl cis-trans isomerase [Sulfurimonas sp.]
MYKIFLTLILLSSLNAELINGVAVVVKGNPITLYDVKEEMRMSGVNNKVATDILIRKKLEELEVKERKISVTTAEVYDNIKKTASTNKMSVSDFYEAVRVSNGLSSAEFKLKTKEKLLSQKLYSTIAYSSVSQPSEDEIKEYYKLHKKEFSHPTAFNVISYTTKDKVKLLKKINSPMSLLPDIQTQERRLVYDAISPELGKFLEKSKLNSFTSIIPDGKGAFVSFYLKEIESVKIGYEDVKNRVANLIMSSKREQVLSDYFARLKDNADIQMIREVK